MRSRRRSCTALPAGTRVYLYMGGWEGEESISHVERMAQLLRTHMGSRQRGRGTSSGDAEHNERSWRAEFPGACAGSSTSRP